MSKKAGNPYKPLYWIGAVLLLLVLGVAMLILLRPGGTALPPDPERTLLYLYDPAHPSGAPAAVIVEESRSRAALKVVAFAPSTRAVQAFQGTGSRAAQDLSAVDVRHRLHHRVFLPYSIIASLVDAAGGITVDGRRLSGAQATAYVSADPAQGPRRAALVMLALADAVSARGVEMGLSEGLAMARQVDSDLDLTEIPDILGRWSRYADPQVETVPGNDPVGSGMLLAPDPPGK